MCPEYLDLVRLYQSELTAQARWIGQLRPDDAPENFRAVRDCIRAARERVRRTKDAMERHGDEHGCVGLFITKVA
jgi:hypothetical protein